MPTDSRNEAVTGVRTAAPQRGASIDPASYKGTNFLSVTIVTKNEEHNLPRLLASLAGIADEIVVVDSGSTDGTCQIALAQGVHLIARAWGGDADQRNFAADAAAHNWILSLDADEELSPELRASLNKWKRSPARFDAYEVSRRSRYLGRWIRHSGWYPDRKTRLYRRDRAGFELWMHAALRVRGKTGRLKGDLLHYTINSLEEHLSKIESYSTGRAEELFQMGRRRWRGALLVAPAWLMFRTYIVQGGFLDGRHGWLLAKMSFRYTRLKYEKLGRLVHGGKIREQKTSPGNAQQPGNSP